MEQWTDEQLIELLRQGDQGAYRQLVERHRNYVYTLIYRMVEHRETAEDLAQEVFIKCYRSIHLFRGDAKFTTWLYRMAVNRVADYRRAQRRRPVESVLDRIKEWFGNREDEPEEQAMRTETKEEMQEMLKQLPEKYRMPLYLLHYMQLSYQEISLILAIPVKTVETRLYRGKSMLKQKWMEVHGNDKATSVRTTNPVVSKRSMPDGNS